MKKLLSVLLFLFVLSVAHAQQSCANYPYGSGETDVQDVQGGTKILATAGVSVAMDDIDSIHDAREEATIEAKALIAKFLNEDISSDSKIDKIVNESKQADGQSVKVDRKELINRVKSLRNSAKALLRGVVTLGSCYTKGRELRVTVGLKPETIKSAENLAGSINSSMSKQPTPQSGTAAGSKVNGGSESSGSGVSQPLRGMDEHSNSEKLKTF